MRDDVGELATERRGLRPSIGDRLRETPELPVRRGDEIQHLREPSTALELNVKSPVAFQHLTDSRAHGGIDTALWIPVLRQSTFNRISVPSTSGSSPSWSSHEER